MGSSPASRRSLSQSGDSLEVESYLERTFLEKRASDVEGNHGSGRLQSRLDTPVTLRSKGERQREKEIEIARPPFPPIHRSVLTGQPNHRPPSQASRRTQRGASSSSRRRRRGQSRGGPSPRKRRLIPLRGAPSRRKRPPQCPVRRPSSSGAPLTGRRRRRTRPSRERSSRRESRRRTSRKSSRGGRAHPLPSPSPSLYSLTHLIDSLLCARIPSPTRREKKPKSKKGLSASVGGARGSGEGASRDETGEGVAFVGLALAALVALVGLFFNFRGNDHVTTFFADPESCRSLASPLGDELLARFGHYPPLTVTPHPALFPHSLSRLLTLQ